MLLFVFLGFLLGCLFVCVLYYLVPYIYKRIYFSKLELLQIDGTRKLKTYRELRKECKCFDYVIDKCDNHNEREDKSNEKSDN